MEKNGVVINKSLEKGLNIIETLATNGNSLKLKDLSHLVGYDTSTTFRFLTTLMKNGYVAQDPDTLKYNLTYKFSSISNEVNKSISMREVARPYLKELVTVFKETVTLSYHHDMSVVYLDVIDGNDHILSTTNYIGRIAPLHCTGAGKLLLQNYCDDELDVMIREKGLDKFTENTIVSKEQLLKELEQVKELGYAYDNEECEYGVKCISFPITNSTNQIVAAFSVTGPITRLSDDYIKERIHYLRQTSKLLSEKFGDYRLS